MSKFIDRFMVTDVTERPYVDDSNDKDQLRYENYLRSRIAVRNIECPGPFSDDGSWHFYYSHGDYFVDFSTFYSTLSYIAFDAVSQLEAEEDCVRHMTLWTYGAVDVWVNGEKCAEVDVPVYKPITKREFSAKLKKGANEIYVRLQNLGVRDTRNLFAIEVMEDDGVSFTIPQSAEKDELLSAAAFLDGTTMKDGCIMFPCRRSGVSIGCDSGSPDIAKVISKTVWVDASDVISWKMHDDCYIYHIKLSVGNETLRRTIENIASVKPVYSGASSWEDNFRRKLAAIASVEGLSRGGKFGFYIQNILARKALGIENPNDRAYFMTTLDQIESRFDCSDFLVSGVIRYLKNYSVDPELKARIDEVLLGYRYWMTMEGSDAMCFWSENHSLLFYSSAMLVGAMYPDSYFTRAKMTGRELEAFGRTLVSQWFDDFEEYGFEEFLSTVYMNVTFACLLNIIDYADKDISERARKAADLMLEELSLHTFRGAIVAPMGRVYRSVIYPTMQGAASLMNLVNPDVPTSFGEGWLSYYATSSYAIPDRLVSLMNDAVDSVYSTGNALISIRKSNDYILTSVQSPRLDGKGRWTNVMLSGKRASEESHEYTKSFNERFHGTTYFEPGVYGYQQHMWSAALSAEALVFVNHPGAFSDSSSSRPGYWYGNGVMPAIRQDGRMLGAVYSIPLTHPVPFTHIFLPECKFDEIRKDGSWIFLRKGNGFLALWISGDAVPYNDQLFDSELRVYDREAAYFVFAGSVSEDSSFPAFIDKAKSLSPVFDRKERTLDVSGRIFTSFADSSDRTQYVEGIKPLTLSEVFSSSLAAKPEERNWIENHQLLLGDVHNHSGISYGHGTLERAIAFAGGQLDFFSVTGHFAWPDMDKEGMRIPDEVKAYHREGFAKLRRVWPEYLKAMAASGSLGLVPFASYEYHSFDYGDYTVVAKAIDEKLPADPEGEDNRLSGLVASNDPGKSGLLPIPHHIGYKEGYRGISWKRFNQNASPLVEIVSMHGAAESENAFPAYLHTMGPRSGENTMQGGLAEGLVFGVVGNTDHHSSSPGSYGSGRTGLWAVGKDRESIWKALLEKHTVALTGDRIETAFFLNGKTFGNIVEVSDRVDVDLYLLARSRLSRVEIIQDGEVVLSESSFRPNNGDIKLYDFAVGWGGRGKLCEWTVTLTVSGADLKDVQPRLKGEMIVDPLAKSKDDGYVPKVERKANSIVLKARTDGNPTPTTDCTQGFSFSVERNSEYSIAIDVVCEYEGKKVERHYSYDSAALSKGSASEYIDGFVSPALLLSREMDSAECSYELHRSFDVRKDGYMYVRATEERGDEVWTTPIWVRRK